MNLRNASEKRQREREEAAFSKLAVVCSLVIGLVSSQPAYNVASPFFPFPQNFSVLLPHTHQVHHFVSTNVGSSPQLTAARRGSPVWPPVGAGRTADSVLTWVGYGLGLYSQS